MTLIYGLDLGILKLYPHTTKWSLSRSRLSNVGAWSVQTDRQTQTHTDRRDRTHYHAAFTGGNEQTGS